MNITVSNKDGKAYSIKTETPAFVGKKIKATVKLDSIGLTGFEGQIKGGSDKQGIPMKHDLEGMNRKKIFIVTDKKKGIRKRITKRGNTVSDETAQINIKITKEGTKKIEEILGKPETKKETTETKKEPEKEIEKPKETTTKEKKEHELKEKPKEEKKETTETKKEPEKEIEKPKEEKKETTETKKVEKNDLNE
jgi:small subunit ribosomal protein S6e